MSTMSTREFAFVDERPRARTRIMRAREGSDLSTMSIRVREQR